MTRLQFRPPDHDHEHFLLTTVVGSYPQPEWLDRIRALHADGAVSDEVRDEAVEDAVRAAVTDQQNAGLDVVTDGEMRREGMVDYFTNFIHGYDPAGDDGDSSDWNAQMPTVTDTVETEAPWLVDDFRFADSVAARPVKTTITGPFTMASFSSLEAYDDVEQLAYDFADLIAAEAGRLADAGANYIQVDEPALGMSPHGAIAHECLSRIAAEIPDDVRFGVHVCSGNYANLADDMFEFPVDELDLEFGSDDADPVAEVFADADLSMDVGLGVVDTTSREPETVEAVKENIRAGLEFIPPDRLTVSPDCGLKPLPRDVAREKLTNMVQAAREVEAELDAGDVEPVADE
ncbi:methionine synthase [Halobacteriaceae archaeon GCM10025711]